MSGRARAGATGDIRAARSLFPATGKAASFDTAAVGLASRALVAAYRGYLEEWTESGLDYVRGEAAGESASIVSVPLGDADPTSLLAELKRRGVICSARDGNVRLAVHLYNHEDDIARAARAFSEVPRPA
jgi:hypothetical protein